MLSVEVEGATYLSLSWADVEEYASDLAERIHTSYQPDTLLAVMKGGAIVGVLVADRLGIGRVYTVNLRSYERVGLREGVEVYQKPPKECIGGKRVLIVDDIVDSGQSLTTVIQLAREYGAKDVRSATLLMKEGSMFMPDYYLRKVRGWVFYPWEVREACEEIYVKIGDVEKAKEILTAGLGFPQREVDKMLARVMRRVG
jgi:hypoxanthine phosphoribosyltransferase